MMSSIFPTHSTSLLVEDEDGGAGSRYPEEENGKQLFESIPFCFLVRAISAKMLGASQNCTTLVFDYVHPASPFES